MQEGEGEKMFAAQTQVQWVIFKCVFLKSCCETFKLQVGFSVRTARARKDLKML